MHGRGGHLAHSKKAEWQAGPLACQACGTITASSLGGCSESSGAAERQPPSVAVLASSASVEPPESTGVVPASLGAGPVPASRGV
jgi:hypothetical protein